MRKKTVFNVRISWLLLKLGHLKSLVPPAREAEDKFCLEILKIPLQEPFLRINENEIW